MEKNELNKNAMGGTELLAARLGQHLNDELLQNFQIHSSRVRELDQTRKQVFWAHDLATDAEAFQALGEERWKRFDLIVFVSHWQQAMYQAYLAVPFSAGVVIENGIEPFPEHHKPTEKIRLIYHSTPHRGLNILYSAFKHLDDTFDLHDVELNVFSSFDLYGWEARDKPYEKLFEALDNHPRINYSKSVKNERIRGELQRSHIHAYPSTWQETSCLCLIEAMCAGLICVHSSLGALPETSMGRTMMYQYTEDQGVHASRFATELDKAIQIARMHNQYSHVTDHRVAAKYDFRHKAREWREQLEQILN